MMLLISLFFAYRALGSAILEGSAWMVKVRAKSWFAFARKDTLVFERGRFTSARYLSSGFLPSGYSVQNLSEDKRRFEASLVRWDGSTLAWTGEVRGDRMKGTVVWTRVDGRTKKYAFRGKRKPSPPVAARLLRRRLASLWRRFR